MCLSKEFDDVLPEEILQAREMYLGTSPGRVTDPQSLFGFIAETLFLENIVSVRLRISQLLNLHETSTNPPPAPPRKKKSGYGSARLTKIYKRARRALNRSSSQEEQAPTPSTPSAEIVSYD